MKDVFLLCFLLPLTALAEDSGTTAQTRRPEPIQVSAASDKNLVDGQAMQRIYDEVKTPFKYGVVVKGPTRKIMVDSPSVFRHSGSWYMMHIAIKGHAHKPWVVRHEGVVYHFYCAVGDQGRVIALATSRDLKADAATGSAEE